MVSSCRNKSPTVPIIHPLICTRLFVSTQRSGLSLNPSIWSWPNPSPPHSLVSKFRKPSTSLSQLLDRGDLTSAEELIQAILKPLWPFSLCGSLFQQLTLSQHTKYRADFKTSNNARSSIYKVDPWRPPFVLHCVRICPPRSTSLSFVLPVLSDCHSVPIHRPHVPKGRFKIGFSEPASFTLSSLDFQRSYLHKFTSFFFREFSTRIKVFCPVSLSKRDWNSSVSLAHLIIWLSSSSGLSVEVVGARSFWIWPWWWWFVLWSLVSRSQVESETVAWSPSKYGSRSWNVFPCHFRDGTLFLLSGSVVVLDPPSSCSSSSSFNLLLSTWK